MFPTVNPGMDNKTKIELLRITLEQQLAKCERALAGKTKEDRRVSELDADARAIINRYKKDLEDILKLCDDLDSQGISRIWRKSKAMGKLGLKIVKLKRSYNIEEYKTIEGVLSDGD